LKDWENVTKYAEYSAFTVEEEGDPLRFEMNYASFVGGDAGNTAQWTSHFMPVASLMITVGGVVFIKFWTFLGFENWSSQWLYRGNLSF